MTVPTQPIQFISVNELMPEFERLHREIRELKEKIEYQKDESLLSDLQASERLHVSPTTLRRMKADGRIKSVLTPKGRAVRVCDIEDYFTPRKGDLTLKK